VLKASTVPYTLFFPNHQGPHKYHTMNQLVDNAGSESVGEEDDTRRPRFLTISDISDDLIEEVFKFLGQGHFLFVAITSRRFHRIYRSTCENCNDTGTTMRSAVESISRLQWARSNGCPWDERTCACAARNGHLEVLQWSRANGCPWDWRTCDDAARNGHLEVLQWARANGCPR